MAVIDWLVNHTVWDLLGWVTYGALLLAVVEFFWRMLVTDRKRRGGEEEHAEAGK